MDKTDIPNKTLRVNVGIFLSFFPNYLNKSIDSSIFPNCLKLTNIAPVKQNDSQRNKDTKKTHQLVHYQTCQSFGKHLVSADRLQCIFNKTFQTTN